MKIVIVGGGKLGYYLTRSLTDYGHEVVVIEKNKTNSMIIADELGANVICADGTEIDVLIAAGINKAECLVAVTGQDQDNLVAAQLAKEKFKIKKVIARANNPRNLEVLTRLGIENAVSSTDIITRMIEQEIDRDELSLIATLNKGSNMCNKGTKECEHKWIFNKRHKFTKVIVNNFNSKGRTTYYS